MCRGRRAAGRGQDGVEPVRFVRIGAGARRAPWPRGRAERITPRLADLACGHEVKHVQEGRGVGEEIAA